VFSASGEMVMTMGVGGRFTGVALWGDTIFAQGNTKCVVFT
jgi:hypothetical protein